MAYLLAFVFTNCSQATVVTLHSKTEFDDVWKIDQNITKECATQPTVTSLGNKTNEIIDKKNAILMVADKFQSKKAELAWLQNQTYALSNLSQQNQSKNNALYIIAAQLNVTQHDVNQLQQELLLAQQNLTSTTANVVVVPANQEQQNQLNSEINKINEIAVVELDQKIYTWTDRVYITIISPSDNKDPNTIENIGTTKGREIVISTHNSTLNYSLTETGYNTNIFTGYITLSGFPSLNVGDNEDPKYARGYTYGFGPTDGFISASPGDNLTVSYHYAPGITITGSALIRWNIGEVRWLGTNYTTNGQGEIQIIDPDMNLNPNVNDTFKITVFSNSEPQGTKITMTEIDRDTGIFRGIVHFTSTQPSSGELKVSEGDTVTAVYVDRTLPSPYHIGDSLKIASVQQIQIPYDHTILNESIIIHKNK